MSTQTHLLIACLQVSLWLFRGFVLDEPALFSALVLAMFLWYHCLNAVFGGEARLERSARFWANGWLLMTVACAVVPPLFDMQGWPLQETLRTVLFASPCFLLYWLPLATSEREFGCSDQPMRNW